jgi:hypothetical protein
VLEGEFRLEREEQTQATVSRRRVRVGLGSIDDQPRGVNGLSHLELSSLGQVVEVDSETGDGGDVRGGPVRASETRGNPGRPTFRAGLEDGECLCELRRREVELEELVR